MIWTKICAKSTFSGFFDDLEDQVFDESPTLTSGPSKDKEVQIFWNPESSNTQALKAMPLQAIKQRIILTESKLEQIRKHLRELRIIYHNRRIMENSLNDLQGVRAPFLDFI